MDDQLEAIDRLLDGGELKRAGVLIARLLRAVEMETEMHARLLLRRASVRLLSEKPEDALEDLSWACRLLPDLREDPAIQELTGDAYFARFELAPLGFADRSDMDQALQCYDALIACHADYPGIGWAFYQKGRILLNHDRVEEAVESFREALRCPGPITRLPALCYERLGFVRLFENQDPAGALSLFAQAAAAYPPGENPDWLAQLHLLRSRALREQRQYWEALAAARQALETLGQHSPGDRRTLAEARLSIGETLAHLAGSEEEAVDHLVEYLQLSRRPLGVDVAWSRVHETIGDLSFRRGRYEQAIQAYTDALAFNPYHPLASTLHYQIARCSYRMGLYQDTIAAVEEMQRQAAADGEQLRDYRFYYLLGSARYALRQYVAAAAAYRRALELAPPGSDKVETTQRYLRLAENFARTRQPGQPPGEPLESGDLVDNHE